MSDCSPVKEERELGLDRREFCVDIYIFTCTLLTLLYFNH